MYNRSIFNRINYTLLLLTCFFTHIASTKRLDRDVCVTFEFQHYSLGGSVVRWWVVAIDYWLAYCVFGEVVDFLRRFHRVPIRRRRVPIADSPNEGRGKEGTSVPVNVRSGVEASNVACENRVWQEDDNDDDGTQRIIRCCLGIWKQ
jgi:hypothetical protein